MRQIYLDNAATTKVSDEVIRAMIPFFSHKFGNASSSHRVGHEAKATMEKARKIIAKSIKAKSNEIVFTSGGTEGNNFALKGLFFANSKSGKNHIITTKIEHDCVLNTCKWLETQGAEVTYLDVNEEGFIDIKDLERNIRRDTLVVSVIQGNNEIGTIQNLEAIGRICRKKGVYFHTDACQSYMKTELNVKKQNLDLVTLNAHKLHGPKGVGVLYIKRGTNIIPLFHGGGHESGMRSGTENVPSIVGFGEAVRTFNKKDIENMKKLKDYLIKGLLMLGNVKINGPRQHRLCNNVNISFNNVEGEAVGGYLEREGIYTSTGSACASHSLKKSHVLEAIGLSHLQINSSLRLSLSKYTTKEEIDYVLKVLPGIVNKLRKISPIK